ncbi:MAG: ADOP family duplicated permease, partial [Bryobacteraceae bacterium]
MRVIGRLGQGISMDQARASVSVIAARLADANPATHRGWGIRVAKFDETRAGDQGIVEKGLAFLMAVVGLVLLVACANVANLLLARASERRREIAARLAVGARRWDIVRQLLAESVMLAVLGGALGVTLAMWGGDLIRAIRVPMPFTMALDVNVDVRVLAFTIVLALASALLFGLAPALQASRPDLLSALKDDAGAGRPARSRLRSTLMVTQVSVSLLLLICAGLFLRSLGNALRIDPGIQREGLLVLSMDLALQGYSEERGLTFVREFLEQARSLPGIQTAAVSTTIPLGFSRSSWVVEVDGRPAQPGQENEVYGSLVTPDFFEATGVTLAAGRKLTPQDAGRAPRVAIINETLARRYFPGGNAIGSRLRINGPQGYVCEVAGIARDAKYVTLGEDPRPFLYQPYEQHYDGEVSFVVKQSAQGRGPERTRLQVEALRKLSRTLDPNLPVFDVKTIEEHLGISLLPARATGTLLGIFGLAGLGLAAIGLYGVTSYITGLRTREIGIRMALGARRSDVLALVLRQGMRHVAIGMMLGLAAALALTRFLAKLLYGLSATDWVTFAGQAALLGAVALAACLIPARRATRVQPTAALRYE